MIKKIQKFLKITGAFFVIYFFVFIFSATTFKISQEIDNLKKSETVKVYPKNVKIMGNKHISREEVLLLAGLDHEKSYYALDKKQIRLYIETNRWVKNCFVEKIFPNKIKILIEEYKPAIIVNSRKSSDKDSGYSLWFAGKDGVVFKKTFPLENKEKLPIFYIDYNEVGRNERVEKIKMAVKINNVLATKDGICDSLAIYYNVTEGFFADCKKKRRTVRLFLGQISDKMLFKIKDKFKNSFSKLKKRKYWAKEFYFDDKNNRIIASRVVRLNK